MKTINSKDDLNTFFQVVEKCRDNKHLDVEQEFENLPDIFHSILDLDQYILPKHISAELLKNSLIKCCRRFQPNFIMDSYCTSIYNAVLMYIREDPKFLSIKPGFSFKKGLLIRGKIGCGKTLLFKGLDDLLRSFIFDGNSNIKIFYPQSANHIAHLYSKHGFETLNRCHPYGEVESYGLVSSNLCIDDLGSEPIVSHFGSQVNIVGELIQLRYGGDYITSATTNLDARALKSFYGERVFSRFKEMFNDLPMDGDDRRF